VEDKKRMKTQDMSIIGKRQHETDLQNNVDEEQHLQSHHYSKTDLGWYLHLQQDVAKNKRNESTHPTEMEKLILTRSSIDSNFT
jgi:hypothetical protein